MKCRYLRLDRVVTEVFLLRELFMKPCVTKKSSGDWGTEVVRGFVKSSEALFNRSHFGRIWVRNWRDKRNWRVTWQSLKRAKTWKKLREGKDVLRPVVVVGKLSICIYHNNLIIHCVYTTCWSFRVQRARKGWKKKYNKVFMFFPIPCDQFYFRKEPCSTFYLIQFWSKSMAKWNVQTWPLFLLTVKNGMCKTEIEALLTCV